MIGFTLIPGLLLVAIVMALWTALRLIFLARVKQNVAGAVSLVAEILIMAGFLFPMGMKDVQSILDWNYVILVGLWLLIPSWLIFVMLFTNHAEWVTRWVNKSSLAIYILLSILLRIIYYHPLTHAWIVKGGEILWFGPYRFFDQKIGWLGSFLMFIGVVESFVTMTLLNRLIKKVNRAYRFQLGTLILVVFFVSIALCLELINWNPISPFSPIMVAFIPSCIFKSWMFFSLRVGQEKKVIKEDIVEFMLGGVIVLDEHQRITYLNPTAARMLGKEKDQFLKRPIAEISLDLASHINAWTRKPMEDDSRFETVILGGMILNSSLSFIEDWKGQITGRVMVLYDITDRVRMEKSLQIHANGLARLNHFSQALSQVSAKVAASAELDQVFQTLSVELRQLGLNFFIGLNRAGQAGYKIEFTSLSSDGLTQIENITGFGILGYLVPDLDDFLQYDATTIDRSIYFPHLMKSIGKILPLLPQGVDHPILNTIGIAPTSAGFLIPLAIPDMGLGIYGVWGPVLQRDDYLTLSSFADEVSAAIQKAWLIADLNALKTFNEEIVQGLAESILKIDSDGTVTFANPAICKLLGISPQSLIGQKWTALIPPDEQKRLLETINHLENDSITGIETIVINQQGRHIPVLVGIQAQRKESIFSGAIISITDIAARVMAENQVRASEREKEALLKEIHHRVKNNLQIISSLLNLQASRSKDPQVEGILQESKSRVRAMALIHEKLYKSSNMDRINFVEYIHNLAETLNQAYGNRSIPVQIYIQADSVFMDIDTAIPCGLIMNELITNSLKHAFSERNGDHSDEMAWIKIELKGITDTRVRLIVSDNGAGFPPNFNYTKQETLGVKLINSLVRQIDGNLTFINHDGARVEIEIPVKYPIYATGEKEDD